MPSITFKTGNPKPKGKIPPGLSPRESVQVLNALETLEDPGVVCEPIFRAHGRDFTEILKPRQMLGAADGKSGGLRGRVAKLIEANNSDAIAEAKALGYPITP